MEKLFEMRRPALAVRAFRDKRYSEALRINDLTHHYSVLNNYRASFKINDLQKGRKMSDIIPFVSCETSGNYSRDSEKSKNIPFRKLIISEESEFLLSKYPCCFLLISYIAIHARRVNGMPDGLIIGDAILGDPKSCGLSRQQYRTALDKLEEFGFIKIISNGKCFFGREKSTIKITINGTLVNILDSRIYDINPDLSNHHINQRATNEQPTSNHKQERTRIIRSKELLLPKQTLVEDSQSSDLTLESSSSIFKNLSSKKIEDDISVFLDLETQHNGYYHTKSLNVNYLEKENTPTLNPKSIAEEANSMPIYECLKNLKIQDKTLIFKHQVSLSKFPEIQVKDAIEYVKTYKEEISSLYAVLLNAIKNEYKKPISVNEIIDNQKLEEKNLIKFHRDWFLKASSLHNFKETEIRDAVTCVWVYLSNGSITMFEYSDPNFKKQIKKYLGKINKWNPNLDVEIDNNVSSFAPN